MSSAAFFDASTLGLRLLLYELALAQYKKKEWPTNLKKPKKAKKEKRCQPKGNSCTPRPTSCLVVYKNNKQPLTLIFVGGCFVLKLRFR